MKAKITTTITTLLDLDTFESEHSVSIDDEDGLSEVSRDIVGAVLIGAIKSTHGAIVQMFPRAGSLPGASLDGEDEGVDIEDVANGG